MTSLVTLYNDRRADENDILNVTLRDISIEGKIKAFCKKPKTKEEIAAYLNIGSVYYTVKRYLTPMIESGILEMTIPEKPKSKFQKYYTIK